jgi:hypothetical protein
LEEIYTPLRNRWWNWGWDNQWLTRPEGAEAVYYIDQEREDLYNKMEYTWTLKVYLLHPLACASQ